MDKIVLFMIGISVPTIPIMLWSIHNIKKSIIFKKVLNNFLKNYPSLLNKKEMDKLMLELNLYSTQEEMEIAISATVAYKKMQLLKEGI